LKERLKIFYFTKKHILKVLLLFFVSWLFFFDENAIIRQLKLKSEINNQKEEIERLKQLIKKDQILITILKSDSLNINMEKILREEYLLSRPNEIIYKIEE
tara:strand:+ start:149 stop:451 length:303 start_codon:yes stop_codon:yes gene_type:complete